MDRVLIIDEAPAGGQPHLFAGKAGINLAETLGVTHETFLSCFDIITVFATPQPAYMVGMGYMVWNGMLMNKTAEYSRILLLGMNVGDTILNNGRVNFGKRWFKICDWVEHPRHPGQKFAVLPTPGGRYRHYNATAMRKTVCDFLRPMVEEVTCAK